MLSRAGPHPVSLDVHVCTSEEENQETALDAFLQPYVLQPIGRLYIAGPLIEVLDRLHVSAPALNGLHIQNKGHGPCRQLPNDFIAPRLMVLTLFDCTPCWASSISSALKNLCIGLPSDEEDDEDVFSPEPFPAAHQMSVLPTARQLIDMLSNLTQLESLWLENVP